MGMNKEASVQAVRLGKLVHGGQSIADGPDGKKLFVWGGLPGELVDVRIIKKHKGILEAVVTAVIEPSADRVEPLEPATYLSTSPWQIMNFASEQSAKQTILQETFIREGLDVEWQTMVTTGESIGYRNKMEFGFFGDEAGLHLAQFVRGSHGKQTVTGSVLASSGINSAANQLCSELNRLQLWGGDLKSVILRSTQRSEVVGALFLKQKHDISSLQLPAAMKGLDVYYSNPKSPASVATELLYSFADTTLSDTILDSTIRYGVLSFFKVNVAVFREALTAIRERIKGEEVVDFYSGVGTIGVPLHAGVLVEAEATNIAFARQNADRATSVIHAPSEQSLEYIGAGHTLIVDPPRAGLHRSVIDTILVSKPPKVVYLSCNPATQARDASLLAADYTITYARGYNFFPRTPHIESLIVLELR